MRMRTSLRSLLQKIHDALPLLGDDFMGSRDQQRAVTGILDLKQGRNLAYGPLDLIDRKGLGTSRRDRIVFGPFGFGMSQNDEFQVVIIRQQRALRAQTVPEHRLVRVGALFHNADDPGRIVGKHFKPFLLLVQIGAALVEGIRGVDDDDQALLGRRLGRVEFVEEER